MPVRQLVREMTAESAPNPLFQAVRRRLDPLSSPWTAHPVWFATYCLSVWVGRVLLVGDSQVAATWPAVGIAFGWLMPYVADRANYRKAPFWAVVAVIVLASGIIATTTGQRTPLGTVSGVSGTIAAVATAELYLTTVSYTHLDVYKRQGRRSSTSSWSARWSASCSRRCFSWAWRCTCATR